MTTPLEVMPCTLLCSRFISSLWCNGSLFYFLILVIFLHHTLPIDSLIFTCAFRGGGTHILPPSLSPLFSFSPSSLMYLQQVKGLCPPLPFDWSSTCLGPRAMANLVFLTCVTMASHNQTTFTILI